MRANRNLDSGPLVGQDIITDSDLK
jgi:hypothetical protein